MTCNCRTSGREISHPIWFVRGGKKLYLLPVSGSDSHWYKNLRRTPTLVDKTLPAEPAPAAADGLTAGIRLKGRGR